MSSEPLPTRRLAGRIAPQRSTQYAALASALALPELLLSPLGSALTGHGPVKLAGQPYLLVDLLQRQPESSGRVLYELGAVSDWYEYYDELAGAAGPFLKPLEPAVVPLLPAELVEARRYRGKTNELFSRVLINVARWAHPGRPRCLLDPLMGGGTFLFVALRLGLHVAGIEQQRTDVESTDSYLDAFLRGARIKHRRIAERAGSARRFVYDIEPTAGGRQRAVLVHGRSEEAPALLANLPAELRPDLVAADLPYGIQHSGPLETLLADSLPAWHQVAQPGAVLALAWDATRLPRHSLIELIQRGGFWAVKQGDAWELLAHPVDRVIKRRDVVVAARVER